MMNIRMATPADAKAILSIYAPFVTDTAVTFEEEVPTEEEFRARIEKTLQFFPYLVAEADGELVGYAYASHFHERSAYARSAEMTVYVRKDTEGRGIGRSLYSKLENILAKQNILNVNACIAYPNDPSVCFHDSMGYKTVARFTCCGYKLGRWWDMIWMEKFLGEHKIPPEPVISVHELDNLEAFLH